MSYKLKTLEQLFSSAKILDEIKLREPTLILIAKNVIKTRAMDSDTIIYRMAMMIFHSAALAGAPVIEAIDDPGSVFLNLMEDKEMYNLFEEKLRKSRLNTEEKFTRIFISFLAAAYYYYKACALMEGS